MTGLELTLAAGSVVTALGGALSTIIGRRTADVAALRAEIDELRVAATDNFDNIQQLWELVDEQRIGILLLTQQIVNLGSVPVWSPRKART